MTPTSSLGFSMAAPSSGVMPNSTETPRFQLPPEWQQDNATAQYLDYLYVLYDRANAPLGVRGTYTGLWQQHMRNLIEVDRFAFYLNQ
jgi:hypothetical protein